MENFIVIGGTGEIGRVIVELLAKEGRVIATYNSTPPTLQIDNVEYINFDVLKSSISTLPELDQIRGIVYCPGSINLKPMHKFSREELVNDFTLSAVGALEVVQYYAKAMKRTPNASVVMISTVAVQKGFPFHAQVAMSKGAVEGLTKTLAAELAPRIRVNCVAPSLVNTRLASQFINSDDKLERQAKAHPLGRIGAAEDVAAAVSYLISEDSSWVTGQILHVDGGKSVI